MSGRPATGTIGLLTRYPSACSRVPCPAAMMPPWMIEQGDFVGHLQNRQELSAAPSPYFQRAVHGLLRGPHIFRHHPNEAHARAASPLAVAAQRIAHKHGCLRRMRQLLESHAERSPDRVFRRQRNGCLPELQKAKPDRHRDRPLRDYHKNLRRRQVDSVASTPPIPVDCGRKRPMLLRGNAMLRACRDTPLAASIGSCGARSALLRRDSSTSRLATSACTVPERSVAGGKFPTSEKSAAKKLARRLREPFPALQRGKMSKTFFPCHAIGVEGAAKIEQQGFDRLVHPQCVRMSTGAAHVFLRSGITGSSPASY